MFTYVHLQHSLLLEGYLDYAVSIYISAKDALVSPIVVVLGANANHDCLKMLTIIL